MVENKHLSDLKNLRKKSHLGGGKERIEKQHSKGKNTARERIDLLLDPGSFTELEPFTTHRGDALGLLAEAYPGDGVVTGFGKIDGTTVFVYAQDFTVYGGTLGEVQSAKICRLMDLAVQNGKAIVGLFDSGGARIQEGVRALRGYAEIFKRNVLASGVVPQISVMMGPCAGGAAYSPALTDIIIMVEKQSFMFLTGPEVIKAVTNETIDHQELGGSEVHASVSGTAHLVAASEREALGLVRRVLSYLPSQNRIDGQGIFGKKHTVVNQKVLDDIIPADPKEPYSMHDVIQTIFDDDTCLELMPSWARNAITSLARIGGTSVGVVANEPSVIAGVMDINSADKIARFVRFCDAFHLPLVTFVDSPGFLPGVDQEYHGVIRHGAKVLYAYAEASVPKISIVTRKAYGGAYIVMSSKFLGSDLSLAWPSAEIAVMGAEGAVNILRGGKTDGEISGSDARRNLAEEYQRKLCDFSAAATMGTVDDVIEPSETRGRIISAMDALQNKHVPTPQCKHGNMPV